MTTEKLAGFLSYKDKYDRYHVTLLSKHNSDKWPWDKDHFDVKRIVTKYKNKLQTKFDEIEKQHPLDNYTICSPWERDGFYFVIKKDKLVAEKIYKKIENDDNVSFEQCIIDDLLGFPIVITAKVTMYKTPKFKKVGCSIQVQYIKNLEPIDNKNDNRLTNLY